MKLEAEARSAWRNDLLPLTIVVILSALYFFSFFNRFAGLRSGDGEFGGGIAFLAGLRPYRDYFTAGPPLNVFKSAFELALFGKLLIVSRTLAVLERLMMVALSFVWLRKSFSQLAAAPGAFVAIVVSAGDHTDPVASYNHDAIFFAMLCGFIVCCGLDPSAYRRVLWMGFLAGVAGGLALLTKQTVGAFALLSACVCGCLAVAKMWNRKTALLWTADFVAGAIAPVLILAAYLWRLGALHACLDMMFVSGPKAKASHPLVFLAREVMIAGLFRWWLLVAALMVAVCSRALYRASLRKCASEETGRLFWLICGTLFILLFAVLLWTAEYAAQPLQNSGKAAVYFVMLGTIYLGVVALQQAFHGEREEQQRAFQILLFSSLSVAVAVSLSLSFPAFEAMALPGLGLLVAASFDGTSGRGKAAVLLVSTLAVVLQVREKLAAPFGFDHQDEGSVSASIDKSAHPMLRGMRLPPMTIYFMKDVQATIDTRAGRDGTLFTYPEMGLLYSLSGRYPPTRTASHNMDVVNDSFAQAEAARLLLSPPAVIVYAKPSDEDMRIAELVWREGHPSGQRSIIAAVESIVAHYDLIGTYQLMPQDTPIRIYAHPLPVASDLVPPTIPER